MFLDGFSFLEEEREAWRPFEALLELSDEALDRPVPAAHDWSGRDLMGHLLGWQDVALRVARELAIGETSTAKLAADADWEARGGEVVNAELQAAWSSIPMDELRRRFAEIPGELRGYLTVVPETRWIKHADHLRFFTDETLDHYLDHRADLEAILAAAGRPAR
jgi:hypothetical protein